ncbi:MAG: glycosyltransferase [Chloroflexi bacterium]|nr:glycosyltransferase [Chloroflexota bacterium]
MNILIISHKETWSDPTSPSGYATIGGFTFQLNTISELFDKTTVIVTKRNTPLPSGAHPLVGHNLTVCSLPEPSGSDLRRKIALLAWMPRYLPAIWRAVREADAVHAIVPGDIGTLGMLIALMQRKPLFVRHCGAWGDPETQMDRFLFWLLERIAGGKNIVLATGAADTQPSVANPHIRWIFSTTMHEKELSTIPVSVPWKPGHPLKLVTVARLAPQKKSIGGEAYAPQPVVGHYH